MKCEKCQDKGFTEREHGLVMVFCDCEKGKELKAEITGETSNNPIPVTIFEVEKIKEDGEIKTNTLYDGLGEAHDDGIIGVKPDNRPAGSPDTGQPKQPKKPKAKKKARARAS